MQNITIANMTKADIPAVADIVIEAFNAPPVNESWTKETATQHLLEELREEFSFVAKENNTIIGALVGNISTYDKGPTYFIDSLAVTEKYRGKGIGEQLLQKAIETAKKQNIKTIGLESSPRLRAFEWYKELGFEESGWVELTKNLV